MDDIAQRSEGSNSRKLYKGQTGLPLPCEETRGAGAKPYPAKLGQLFRPQGRGRVLPHDPSGPRLQLQLTPPRGARLRGLCGLSCV